MNGEASAEISLLLRRAADGEALARNQLYEVVYDDLKRMANRLVSRNHEANIQATLLVHEVFIRFAKPKTFESMANRRVFFSIATCAMKQILIDYHRRRAKSVDSPSRFSRSLDAVLEVIESQSGVCFEELHFAMEQLERSDPRQHSVVMHRFFGGLTVAKTAEILEVSEGTVERDWRIARAKLQRILWSIKNGS